MIDDKAQIIENLKVKILLEEEDKGEEYNDKIDEEIEIKEEDVVEWSKLKRTIRDFIKKMKENEKTIEETLEENIEEQVELNKRKRNDEKNYGNEREKVKRKKTESKGFKKILGELRNEAYKMEIKEENDKERLSKRVLSMKRKTIKYCYEIGKDVTNKI
ncbi:hypothetical protein C1645_745998 [Glomus cerebriforme]|uniref:Uncharacterized protein n=1 Tax=Glomus cerebriforme TaxID=658196 RepID=A0A397S3K9_9GLOM|nr:hypothetical protein C1645_745998 [Glomus cerebriforme]